MPSPRRTHREVASFFEPFYIYQSFQIITLYNAYLATEF